MPTYEEAQKIEAVQKILSSATNDELLEALKDERELFTRSNKEIMKIMIDELIRRKVYPENTPEGNRNDVYTMVSGWGAYWHIWSGTLECPHCKADLRDQRVGPPFIRQIGISDLNRDRVTMWQCPDCKGQWARD
jgi:hypothetical protein